MVSRKQWNLSLVLRDVQDCNRQGGGWKTVHSSTAVLMQYNSVPKPIGTFAPPPNTTWTLTLNLLVTFFPLLTFLCDENYYTSKSSSKISWYLSLSRSTVIIFGSKFIKYIYSSTAALFTLLPVTNIIVFST